MPKAEYRSAIRSRQLIKASLADLLSKKPLDKITVTDVVKHANINRGTFYAHYSDIPNVIESLVDESFCRLRDALIAEPHRLIEVPHIIIRQAQKLLEEDLDFFRKIMLSNVSSQVINRMCDVMLDYLLIHEKDFSVVSHEEYIFKLRFCAGGLSTLYRDWFAGLLPFSLEELSARAEKTLVGMVSEIGSSQ